MQWYQTIASRSGLNMKRGRHTTKASTKSSKKAGLKESGVAGLKESGVAGLEEAKEAASAASGTDMSAITDGVKEAAERSKTDTIVHKTPYISPGLKRGIIVGGSNTGKTFLLTELIPMLYDIEHLFIYCADPMQDTFKILQRWCEDNEINFYITTEQPSIDKFDEHADELRAAGHSVVVFDDLDSFASVIPFYKRGRHLNCSFFLVTQRLFDIPKEIRINVNMLILFKSFDSNVTIQTSLPSFLFPEGKELFKKVMAEVNKMPRKEHSYLYIDIDHDFLFQIQKKIGGLLTSRMPPWMVAATQPTSLSGSFVADPSLLTALKKRQ